MLNKKSPFSFERALRNQRFVSIFLVSMSVFALFLISCSENNPTPLGGGDPLPLSSTPLGSISSAANNLSGGPVSSSQGNIPVSSVIIPLSSVGNIPASSTPNNISSSRPNSVAISSSSQTALYSSAASRLTAITQRCAGRMPNRISGGSAGYGSRYWDCCKPHCSQRENIDTNAVPFSICANCSVDNEEIPAFRVSPNANQWWHGYEGTRSGCLSDGEAYTCYSHAPFAVCDSLAYGFAAVALSEPACGRCFQLDFDGGNREGNVKAAHRLLAGKTMIVMASNTGSDVGSGQFDIMIPGGGVGMFAGGCGVQWGVNTANEDLVGVRYGGLISKCQQIHGWDAPVNTYKQCVRTMCSNLFGQDPSMTHLYEGCIWFVDWMHTADNPTFRYAEVPCPPELVQLYRSTKHPTKDLP